MATITATVAGERNDATERLSRATQGAPSFTSTTWTRIRRAARALQHTECYRLHWGCHCRGSCDGTVRERDRRNEPDKGDCDAMNHVTSQLCSTAR
jgi:hypothetical protein